MEQYGQILNIAMPVFLVLVLLEKAYGWYKFKHSFNTMDTLASMSSGYSNVLKDVLGLSVSILTYGWLVKHVAFFEIKSTVWTYVIAFIALDFSSYWIHRISHKINFFWNKHAVHHSSEEFNLACALRQSISSFVSLFTFFLIPAALLGVPASVIGITAPIHLFAQFWYHTVYIKNMGFLEKILVTPAHHRVHHAINPEYLDKNLAAIFIIWDKLFGTFQEELPNVPAVYGITRPASTWNPIKINFQHLWLLIQDAWRTESIKDKLTIWFQPTGWRPADVEAKYPVKKIEDIYNFEKYAPATSPKLEAWTWVQFLFTFSLIVFLFSNIVAIGSPNIFVYGTFVFVSIYAYSELMDGNPDALYYEIAKSAFGLGLITHFGNWFGAGLGHTVFIAVYLVASVCVTAWFSIKNTVQVQA
jgi:alkylglycerol monooxygenase